MYHSILVSYSQVQTVVSPGVILASGHCALPGLMKSGCTNSPVVIALFNAVTL
jgi:hypothetical protein